MEPSQPKEDRRMVAMYIRRVPRDTQLRGVQHHLHT